jgi:hypothetical protein
MHWTWKAWVGFEQQGLREVLAAALQALLAAAARQAADMANRPPLSVVASMPISCMLK